MDPMAACSCAHPGSNASTASSTIPHPAHPARLDLWYSLTEHGVVRLEGPNPLSVQSWQILHAVVWKMAGKSMGVRAVGARDCDEMIPIWKIWKKDLELVVSTKRMSEREREGENKFGVLRIQILSCDAKTRSTCCAIHVLRCHTE